MNMLKPLLSMASPSGRRARLSVLIFHRVLPRPDPLFPGEVDARRFDEICRWVARHLHVLPLEDAVRHLKERTLPARAAAITFDDGYADNHDVALPILGRHGLHATFFIASGFLDGSCMWNDRVIEAVRAAPDRVALDELLPGQPGVLDLGAVAARRQLIDAALAHAKYLPAGDRHHFVAQFAARLGHVSSVPLMMRPGQVQALRRAGMSIGAHTMQHPILATLSLEEARREIAGGRDMLEQLLGERVGLFAYPNGKPEQDYRSEHVALVRSLGFDAAFSTAWGASGAGDDLYQIRRFTPWDRPLPKFGLRLAANLLGRRPDLVH